MVFDRLYGLHVNVVHYQVVANTLNSACSLATFYRVVKFD